MKLDDLAKKMGFDYLRKVPRKYGKYDVYVPDFKNEDEAPSIGWPRFVLVKDGKYRILYGNEPEGEKVWMFVNSVWPPDDGSDPDEDESEE